MHFEAAEIAGMCSACFKIVDICCASLLFRLPKSCCRRTDFLVNSPEQIFAEKCLSLGRLGPASTRYKDICDLYYLIESGVAAKKVNSILKTLIKDAARPPFDLEGLKSNVFRALDDDFFAREAKSAKNQRLDEDYLVIADALKAFLEKSAPVD